MENPFAESGQRAAEPACRNAAFSQLLYGAQSDEIVKIIETIVLFFTRRDETQTIPVLQLFWCEVQNPLDFFAAESVG